MKSIPGTSATATRCSPRSATSAISSSPRRTSGRQEGLARQVLRRRRERLRALLRRLRRQEEDVAELKRALKDADELLLATDEDREGEAIAWHLLQELQAEGPVRRMVFHEITKDAILEAKDHTRELDLALVDAQETRRILDRLYGYEVSPVLWRKVGPGMSAGRVQSAATRLVVDRERERWPSWPPPTGT